MVGIRPPWRSETETGGRTGHHVTFNRPNGRRLAMASFWRGEVRSVAGGFAGGGSCSGLLTPLVVVFALLRDLLRELHAQADQR